MRKIMTAWTTRRDVKSARALTIYVANHMMSQTFMTPADLAELDAARAAARA